MNILHYFDKTDSMTAQYIAMLSRVSSHETAMFFATDCQEALKILQMADINILHIHELSECFFGCDGTGAGVHRLPDFLPKLAPRPFAWSSLPTDSWNLGFSTSDIGKRSSLKPYCSNAASSVRHTPSLWKVPWKKSVCAN